MWLSYCLSLPSSLCVPSISLLLAVFSYSAGCVWTPLWWLLPCCRGPLSFPYAFGGWPIFTVVTQGLVFIVLFCFVVLSRVSLYILTIFVYQAGLELEISLAPLPQCWDGRVCASTLSKHPLFWPKHIPHTLFSALLIPSGSALGESRVTLAASLSSQSV